MTVRRFVLVAAGALWAAACQTSAPTPPPPGFAPAQPVASATASPPTDGLLWRMSRDPAVVSAGQAAFRSSSCGSCHGFMLTGGTGPNLIDRGWLHGGTPAQVFQTITRGVPSKGMPTWGPVLGPKRIGEIVAYIFSLHQEGEPIVVQASFTPGSPAYAY